MEPGPLYREGRRRRLRRVDRRPVPHGRRRVRVVDRGGGAAALGRRREAVPRAGRRLGPLIRRVPLPPARVDAEDAHDEDAELEEDEGRGRHDHHCPAGAEHVALGVVPSYEHWNGHWSSVTCPITVAVVKHLCFAPSDRYFDRPTLFRF